MASVLNPESPTCQRCSALEPCRVRALQSLDRVKGAIKVDHLIERLEHGSTQGYILSLEDHRAIATTPRKVAGRLESLLTKGFHVIARRKLAAGQNPFPVSGAKHIHLAGEMLLAGGFTKGQLRQQCIERFQWTEGTAFSEVSQAVALLRGLRLVRQTQDHIHL